MGRLSGLPARPGSRPRTQAHHSCWGDTAHVTKHTQHCSRPRQASAHRMLRWPLPPTHHPSVIVPDPLPRRTLALPSPHAHTSAPLPAQSTPCLPLCMARAGVPPTSGLPAAALCPALATPCSPAALYLQFSTAIATRRPPCTRHLPHRPPPPVLSCALVFALSFAIHCVLSRF
jgi:hypothetical protein